MIIKTKDLQQTVETAIKTGYKVSVVINGENYDLEIDEKHDKLRKILINYGCKEYGDAIIDDICELLNYPTTGEEE